LRRQPRRVAKHLPLILLALTAYPQAPAFARPELPAVRFDSPWCASSQLTKLLRSPEKLPSRLQQTPIYFLDGTLTFALLSPFKGQVNKGHEYKWRENLYSCH
jgi:hypothetical protein